MALDLTLLAFSRNRAAQADLLLRSIARHVHLPHDVHLLHCASGDEYAAGYEILFREHPSVRAWDEAAHTVDEVLRTLLATETRLLFGMLVDDDLLIRDIRPEDRPLQRLAEDRRIATASLRLAPHKTWSQTHDRPMRVPPIRDGAVDLGSPRPWVVRRVRSALRALRLLPRNRPDYGCWRVPFAVCGNLYVRERLRAFAECLPRFEHVTSVEPSLCKHRRHWDGPLRATLYEEERLVNLVMNNVDSQGERYPHPGFSVADMNRRYLDGARLRGDSFEGGRFPSCHVETEPRFDR